MMGDPQRGPPIAVHSSKEILTFDGNAILEPGVPGNDACMSLARLQRVVAKASWTLLDQALLALSNFAANIVLARWLMPAEFGGYIVAAASFWMISSAYNGLMSDPIMVLGPTQFRDRLSSYFAVLTVFHWCISAFVSVGLAAVGLALMLWGSTAPGSSFLGFALASPAILLLWLVRRTVYLWSHPRLAAVAGGVYMVGMFVINISSTVPRRYRPSQRHSRPLAQAALPPSRSFPQGLSDCGRPDEAAL